MAETKNNDAIVASTNESLITKQSIRRQVWENLEKNNLVNFPRPVFGRIPNFKGCEDASSNLTQLDIFKTSQNVKVNPDKPQEPVRLSVLENQKNLYVPVPRLATGLLKHLTAPDNAGKNDLKKLVSRRGIDQCGKEITEKDSAKIDLIIMGSVAVSKQGYRIGKGRGYADLEYAILTEMGSINPDTIVITTVHDSQVFEDLPSEMFGPHDVPVDIIVTPTQIIEVGKRLPKPTGIFWELISKRRLELMPVLKSLKDSTESSGKEIILKEIDSDVESNKNIRRVRRMRLRRPKPQKNDPADVENDNKPQKRRIVRRRAPKVSENTENQENIDVVKKRPKRHFRRNKSMIDFSLMVKNIEKSVRVRDLKAALAERGIKPNIITWRGMKGYCCLHFSKNNPNTISNVEENSHGVDNVLGMLQNLTINTEKQLEIEIMKPISRIETTDITSV